MRSWRRQRGPARGAGDNPGASVWRPAETLWKGGRGQQHSCHWAVTRNEMTGALGFGLAGTSLTFLGAASWGRETRRGARRTGGAGADHGMKGPKHTSPGRSQRKRSWIKRAASPRGRPWPRGCHCVRGRSLSVWHGATPEGREGSGYRRRTPAGLRLEEETRRICRFGDRKQSSQRCLLCIKN